MPDDSGFAVVPVDGFDGLDTGPDDGRAVLADDPAERHGSVAELDTLSYAASAADAGLVFVALEVEGAHGSSVLSEFDFRPQNVVVGGVAMGGDWGGFVGADHPGGPEFHAADGHVVNPVDTLRQRSVAVV